MPWTVISFRDKLCSVFPLVNRRDFLWTLIKGGVGTTLPYQLFGQKSASAPIAATKIAGNFTHITGAGGNILVVSGPEGLFIVDGGMPDRTPDLMKVIGEQFNGQRVQVLE